MDGSVKCDIRGEIVQNMSWKLTARHDALRESGEYSPQGNIRGFCTEGKGAHPSPYTGTTLKRSTHVSQRDGDVAAVVQGMHENP